MVVCSVLLRTALRCRCWTLRLSLRIRTCHSHGLTQVTLCDIPLSTAPTHTHLAAIPIENPKPISVLRCTAHMYCLCTAYVSPCTAHCTAGTASRSASCAPSRTRCSTAAAASSRPSPASTSPPCCSSSASTSWPSSCASWPSTRDGLEFGAAHWFSCSVVAVSFAFKTYHAQVYP